MKGENELKSKEKQSKKKEENKNWRNWHESGTKRVRQCLKKRNESCKKMKKEEQWMKYDVNRLRKRRIEESVKKRINGKVCEREKQ